MKLGSTLFIFSFLLIATCHCQSAESDYLIKVINGQNDEVGTPTGYINIKGDTIIPIGQYYYCYTDTLKYFGVVVQKDGKLIGINKAGKELFEVFWYDNGPDYLADGLFRIIKNGKIGYADERGLIVIKPKFDCAYPFENGKAKVSFHCATISSGEYKFWESNSWFYIDKTGKKNAL
jgi:hypothetical protein